jgi:NADPH:quinone reductase-like Zn-dependent oxidoreductase
VRPRGSRSRLGALVGGAGLVAAYMLTHRTRPYDLRGKTVLITGGSRGLGLILAREVGRAGGRVAICGAMLQRWIAPGMTFTDEERPRRPFRATLRCAPR